MPIGVLSSYVVVFYVKITQIFKKNCCKIWAV